MQCESAKKPEALGQFDRPTIVEDFDPIQWQRQVLPPQHDSILKKGRPHQPSTPVEPPIHKVLRHAYFLADAVHRQRDRAHARGHPLDRPPYLPDRKIRPGKFLRSCPRRQDRKRNQFPTIGCEVHPPDLADSRCHLRPQFEFYDRRPVPTNKAPHPQPRSAITGLAWIVQWNPKKRQYSSPSDRASPGDAVPRSPN